MGFATVRATLTNFLIANQPQLANVATIHPAVPRWAAGDEWDMPTSQPGGAVLAVHLGHKTERRIGLPALTGQKWVGYQASVLIFYKYVLGAGLSPYELPDEAAWVGLFDDCIDSLDDLLRSAPNLGDPDVVFQSAQGSNAQQNDLTVSVGLPRIGPGGGYLLNFVGLDFQIAEIITA